MKYRKKPVVIDAWLCRDIIEAFKRDRWAGMPPEVEAEQDRNGYWLVTTPHAPEGEGIYIPTLEGSMLAKPDDMIIMGVQGEFYPCKPEIFEATYERVEDGAKTSSDALHPDWALSDEYSTPFYDFKEAMNVARQYAATIPSKVLTPTVSLSDVQMVVKYHATYGYGDTPWKPGDDTGTELDLKVLLVLKDGRMGFLTGWNDYTGWGCQDGADLRVGTFEQIMSVVTADERSWILEGFTFA